MKGFWISLMTSLWLVAFAVLYAQAQTITLTNPIVADPRSTPTLNIVHLQIDLRTAEVVVTMASSDGTFKRQFKFADTPAVLDDQGVEVTPASNLGSEMLAIILTRSALDAVVDKMISTGKVTGTRG